MRISDWSSDVCSSDLPEDPNLVDRRPARRNDPPHLRRRVRQLAVRRLAAHPAGQFPPDFCTIRAPPSGRGRRSSAFWVFQIFRSISMKENFVVVAEPRADQGKGASRRLRRTGKVDRKSVVEGKRVAVRVDVGGRGINKKKK